VGEGAGEAINQVRRKPALLSPRKIFRPMSAMAKLRPAVDGFRQGKVNDERRKSARNR